MLPVGDHEMIVGWARGVVTGELMVADLSRHEWQTSMALMVEALAEISNLGVVLVPKGPHLSMPWINNTSPGCVFTCTPVAMEDLPALQAEVDRMNAALYPDTNTSTAQAESPG
jgi:hypothetical protein